VHEESTKAQTLESFEDSKGTNLRRNNVEENVRRELKVKEFVEKEDKG
jgi:hypothetical protein